MVGVAVLACVPAVVAAQGRLLTRDEAMAAVYQGARVEAERVFLTPRQIAEASAIARVEIESGLIARYVAVRDGVVVG